MFVVLLHMDYLVWKHHELRGSRMMRRWKRKVPKKEAVISERRGTGKTKVKILFRSKMLEGGHDPRDRGDGDHETSIHFGV